MHSYSNHSREIDNDNKIFQDDLAEIIIEDTPSRLSKQPSSYQRRSVVKYENEECIIFDEQSRQNDDDINLEIESPQNDHQGQNDEVDLDLSNNQQRYGQNFFNQQQRTRQGIPTLTAKSRTTTKILNDIVQPLGNIHDRDIIEEDGRESFNHDKSKNKKNMNAQLLDELQNIEQHQNYKFQIEKFIILFQKDSKEALQYLFDSNIIPDDNIKIAQILLTTEGINRDALNKFFGAPKEKNQAIFKAYCALLDFRGLKFEKALRLLLSRFRMAGEAQQVDRMVCIFAEVFHNDNPTIFVSKDDPYVLAYSLIMLSTDAASTKIAQKNKMTKQQFVKNNVPIFKTIPIAYFEEVYDNITKEPFQTTIDYMEQIYNRMSMCNEKIQGETMKKALNLAFDLMKGSNFVKYGRRGEPKPRRVFLSEDERRICWRSIDKEEPARYINVQEVYDLALGCSNTTDIMRQHNIPIEFDQFCFSIISSYRTLDLKVNDIEGKSKWVNYLRAIILQRREHESRRAQQNLKRVESELKREEIWRVDIFPRWEFHWDYKKHRPQNFQKYQSVRKEETMMKQQRKANQGPSILESFCSCLKNTIPLAALQRAQGAHAPPPIQTQDSNIMMYQQSQDMPFQGRNQSLLLMILWKLGIPDWARKTLWPITVGNRLEFTESLYSIHLNQVANSKRDIKYADKWVQQAFQKIEEDLLLLKDQFPFETNKDGEVIDPKFQSLSNILHAFIFYRPDFGYIRGMGNLAAVLILYIGEYEAMQTFINLIHSYHFLPLFKGDMREIEWRVRFFDENLSKILPLVYNHFKALDISSEIFLIRWFMTLFSPNFPISMTARLWDNFLLEGEIYMFRAAIAYIKYFMLELKMSPFDEVIGILKTHPPEINEDYFFITTDEIPIKEEEYKRFIEQQKIALLNTQIHQAMLQQ